MQKLTITHKLVVVKKMNKNTIPNLEATSMVPIFLSHNIMEYLHC